MNNGQRMLIEAISKNDNSKVRELLDGGVTPDAVYNDDDYTPAMLFAAQVYNREGMQLLIDAGGDINITNKNGRTALMLSALSADLKNLSLLIENKADLDFVSQEGTALILAVQNNKIDSVRMLIEAGANLEVVDNESGLTALSNAFVYGDRVEIAEALVKAGANIDHKSRDGESLRDLAAQEAEMIDWLDSYLEHQALDEAIEPIRISEKSLVF